MERKNKHIMFFIIWSLVTLFYCYQYVLRLLPNVIMPELMKQFSIGAKEFGDYAGIYYIGYVLMQIPIGILLSRFGAKKIIPISIIIAALGTLPMGLDTSWQLVIFGRFMIGVGTSAAIVGAFQIFREIFPNHFARMIGSLVCVGLLTAIYISKPLSIMSNNIGFREMILFLVIAGIILAIISFIFLPQLKESTTPNVLQDIKEIIFNKKVILMSMLAGLMVAPLEGFADAWGTAFIRMVYGIERETADSIVSSILTGMCIGSIILPFIADKTKSYYGTIITSGVIMAGSFGLMLTGIPNNFSLYALCLLIGICCAYQIVIISHISTFVKLPLSGMTSAVSNMIIMAFGFIFHKLIASIIENDPNKTYVDEIPVYSFDAYINGISIIPMALILSVIGFSYLVYIRKL